MRTIARELPTLSHLTALFGPDQARVLGALERHGAAEVVVNYQTPSGERALWRGTAADFPRCWTTLRIPLAHAADERQCALCGALCTTRTAIPERSPGGQVPCCTACAGTHEPEDVPLLTATLRARGCA